MRRAIASIIGGVAGAIALNIVHQTYKQFDVDAPHVDKVGEEALASGLEKVGISVPEGEALFLATLAADLASNAAYYSARGFAKRKYLMLAGTLTGLAAGIGAVTLTGKLGLNDNPVARKSETKILTIAWYTLGGIIAAATTKVLIRK